MKISVIALFILVLSNCKGQTVIDMNKVDSFFKEMNYYNTQIDYHDSVAHVWIKLKNIDSASKGLEMMVLLSALRDNTESLYHSYIENIISEIKNMSISPADKKKIIKQLKSLFIK